MLFTYNGSSQLIVEFVDMLFTENGSSQLFVEYVAVYEFKAQLDGELSLTEGEKLMVSIITCFERIFGNFYHFYS